MKKYRYSSKHKKERNERIGFVTAFTVCIIAIGLAIGSTYASIGGLDGNLSGGGGSGYTATAGYGGDEAVDNEVKGIIVDDREAEETSTSITEPTTTEAQSITQAVETELPKPDAPDTSVDTLETI